MHHHVRRWLVFRPVPFGSARFLDPARVKLARIHGYRFILVRLVCSFMHYLVPSYIFFSFKLMIY